MYVSPWLVILKPGKILRLTAWQKIPSRVPYLRADGGPSAESALITAGLGLNIAREKKHGPTSVKLPKNLALDGTS